MRASSAPDRSAAQGPELAGDPPRTGVARRSLDLVVATAGLVACAPVFVGVALLMRLAGDRGPLLYRARRIGEDGRPFAALKLRTMRPGVGGARVTLAADPRVTRVGAVLRRYRIDELPQLVNVLRGEMSLVGPRPEDPRYVDLDDPVHRFVFRARPGITGPTQLAFRDEAALFAGPDPEADYRSRILPLKLAMDAEYLRRRSIRTDLWILCRTVAVLMPPRRAGAA